MIHHRHVFLFTDPTLLARYICTTPRYQLDALSQNVDAVTDRLRHRGAGQAVTLTSTVTYVVAARP